MWVGGGVSFTRLNPIHTCTTVSHTKNPFTQFPTVLMSMPHAHLKAGFQCGGLRVLTHQKNAAFFFFFFCMLFFEVLPFTTLAVSVNSKTSNKSMQKYAAFFFGVSRPSYSNTCMICSHVKVKACTLRSQLQVFTFTNYAILSVHLHMQKRPDPFTHA